MSSTKVADSRRRARIARNAEAARNRKAEAEANKVATSAALQTVSAETLRLIGTYAEAEAVVIPADIRAAASPSDIATETLLSLAENENGRTHLVNLSATTSAEAARKAKAALRRATRSAIVDLLRRERGREAATTAEAVARSAVTGALRGRKTSNAEAEAVKVYNVAPWAIDEAGNTIASVAEARGQQRRNVATAPTLGRIAAPTIAEAEAVALALGADGEWQRADKDNGRTLALHSAENRGYVAGKAESRAEAVATGKSRNLKAEAATAERASYAEAKAERHKVRPIREAGNPLTPSESLTPSGRPIRLLRGQDLESLLTHQLRFHNDAQDTAPSGRTLASIVADRDSGEVFGRTFSATLSAEVVTRKCRGIVALRAAVTRLESLTIAEAEAVAESAMRAYSDAYDEAEAAREAAPSRVPGSRKLTDTERLKAEAATNAEANADELAEAEAVAIVLREVRKVRPLTLSDLLVTCLRSPSEDAERRTTGAARNRKAKAEAVDATDLAYPQAYAYLGLGDSASNGARALRDIVGRAREVAADEAGNVRPSVPATSAEAIAALRDLEAVAENNAEAEAVARVKLSAARIAEAEAARAYAEAVAEVDATAEAVARVKANREAEAIAEVVDRATPTGRREAGKVAARVRPLGKADYEAIARHEAARGRKAATSATLWQRKAATAKAARKADNAERARREVGLVRFLSERAYRAERQGRGRAATAKAIAERAKAEAEANNAERPTRGRYVAPTPSGYTYAEAEAVTEFLTRQPRPRPSRRLGTRHGALLALAESAEAVARNAERKAEAEYGRIVRDEAEAVAEAVARTRTPEAARKAKAIAEATYAEAEAVALGRLSAARSARWHAHNRRVLVLTADDAEAVATVDEAGTNARYAEAARKAEAAREAATSAATARRTLGYWQAIAERANNAEAAREAATSAAWQAIAEAARVAE